MSSLDGKRILLIVGGGIAAYKVLDLVRRLRERGASVFPVMTEGAEQFITPLSLASLAGAKVHDRLFSLTDEAEMGHIELSARRRPGRGRPLRPPICSPRWPMDSPTISPRRCSSRPTSGRSSRRP